MSIISKLYYPGIYDNTDITNIFDFDNFLDHTKFMNILSVDSSKGLDINLASKLLEYLTSVPSDVNGTRDFIDKRFGNLIYDYTFWEVFSKEFGNHVGSLYNSQNKGHGQALYTNVMGIFNSAVDYSDLATLSSQFMSLPDKYFTFGSNFTPYGDKFDINAFKSDFIELLVKYFYPYHYFIHIQERVKNCDDFKCKRAYLLAKYVFVYYLYMSIFVFLFGTGNAVRDVATTLKKDNASLEVIKYQIVLAMDQILSILQEENLLDGPDGNKVSSLAGFYKEIKALSDSNVRESNFLNEKKNVALIMQNNLSNYTNYEVLAHQELWSLKRSFIIIAVVMLVIIATLIALVISGSYSYAYILSGIVLLGLGINGLVAAIRQ